MVDTADSKSAIARCGGSSPPAGTTTNPLFYELSRLKNILGDNLGDKKYLVFMLSFLSN